MKGLIRFTTIVITFIVFIPNPCSNDYEIGPSSKLQIKVHIWGQVIKPGMYQVDDRTNLLELISLAGGPTEYAKLSKIRITRNSLEDKTVFTYNLDKYLNNPDKYELPVLLPHDTIYIPKNAKAAWREFIKFLSEIALIINMVLLTQQAMK